MVVAVKKRICYKDKLKCNNPNTIKSIIERRVKVKIVVFHATKV